MISGILTSPSAYTCIAMSLDPIKVSLHGRPSYQRRLARAILSVRHLLRQDCRASSASLSAMPSSSGPLASITPSTCTPTARSDAAGTCCAPLALECGLPRAVLAAALWSRSAQMLPQGKFSCMHITPLTTGRGGKETRRKKKFWVNPHKQRFAMTRLPTALPLFWLATAAAIRSPHPPTRRVPARGRLRRPAAPRDADSAWREACEARLANWCATYCGRSDLVASPPPVRRCMPWAASLSGEDAAVSQGADKDSSGTPSTSAAARAALTSNATSTWCARTKPPFEVPALRDVWASCEASARSTPSLSNSSALAATCVSSASLQSVDVPDAEARVASARVVAACLVRDSGAYLERNLGAILAMGRRFARFRLVFVENDSTDSTRAILRRLRHAHPRTVAGEMIDNASATMSFRLCPRKQQARNCPARLALLATLRQRALDIARQYLDGGKDGKPGYDALIFFDADFVSFSAEAYLRSFALGRALGASAIFAVSTYKSDYGVRQNRQARLAPYDRGILPAHLQHPQRLGAAMKHVAACTLLRVTSAFGSFGTYFAPLTRDAHYVRAAAAFRPRAGVGAWTEHTSFNLAIGAAQKGRPMYIDPSFRPTFLYGSGDYWEFLSGRDSQPRAVSSAPVDADVPAHTWCPPTSLCEDASRVGARTYLDYWAS